MSGGPVTGAQVLRQRARRLATGRAAWGLLLLTRPQTVLGGAGSREDTAATVVARVLGGRELVQAAMTATVVGRPVLWAGAVIDLLHAATAVALARQDPARRRPALTNAGTALAWAALGCWAARSTPTTSSQPRPRPADRPSTVPRPITPQEP